MPRGVYERKKKSSTGLVVLKEGEIPLDAIPERSVAKAKPRGIHVKLARNQALEEQRIALAREVLATLRRIMGAP